MSSRNCDDSTNSSSTQIGIEAAEWLVRVQEAEPEEAYPGALARQAAWLDWLNRSPKHLNVFLETLGRERRLHKIDPPRFIGIREPFEARSADVIPLYGSTNQASAERTRNADTTGTPASGQPMRRFTRNAAVGLAAMALILIYAAIFSLNLLGPLTFATRIGEQRTCKLEDGSVVVLNTDTRVQVDYSERVRNIRLLQGEALFIVEHDSNRPFIVTAGDAIVRAVGTEFNVRRRAQSTEVAVVEGVVQVAATEAAPTSETTTAPSAPTEKAATALAPDSRRVRPKRTVPVKLAAGEEAQVAAGNVTKAENPAIADVLSWRQRRLVFRDAPLADVAAEFNRYNRIQIRVEGAAAREKQLTGIFDADRPQSIMLFASKDESLSVQTEGDSWVIRAR